MTVLSQPITYPKISVSQWESYENKYGFEHWVDVHGNLEYVISHEIETTDGYAWHIYDIVEDRFLGHGTAHTLLDASRAIRLQFLEMAQREQNVS